MATKTRTRPKLTETEQTEIAARNTLIVTHRRTAALLESELRLYLNHVLTEKGLDPAKEYAIGEDGTLTPVEATDG